MSRKRKVENFYLNVKDTLTFEDILDEVIDRKVTPRLDKIEKKIDWLMRTKSLDGRDEEADAE